MSTLDLKTFPKANLLKVKIALQILNLLQPASPAIGGNPPRRGAETH